MPIEQQKIVLILRGLPGTGKTWFANRLKDMIDIGGLNFTGLHVATGTVILSSDDYFIKNGVYMFDMDLLTEAHEWNFKRFKESVESNSPFIIVDNTNIKSYHYWHYFEFANRHNYFVAIVTIPHNEKSNRELESSNIHGITQGTIRKMRSLFEWEFREPKKLSERTDDNE